jgi:site-specific DNA recombinase
MQNVVGYVRVFTLGQAKDGYSLQYQVDEEGLTVEREGLQHMLADLSVMDIQHVIVLNTSRLWRSNRAKSIDTT